MTTEKFTSSLIELISLMAEMNYSQTIIEITLGMILPLTTQDKSKAVVAFKSIAEQGLTETEFHCEISKIFEEFMQYERR